MKYFYNGELVRTSKSNRIYEYGLVRYNGYISCHTTREAAQAVLNRENNEFHFKPEEMPKIVKLDREA